MRRRILTVFMAVCLIFSLVPGVLAAESTVTVTVTGIRSDTHARDVVALTNDQRSENGLEPLSHSATLSELAMQRAAEIAIAFEHTRPDGSSPADLMDGVYLNWTSIGENIAMGQSSASSAVNAWMNSEGHRANILNEDFTQIGVGCCRIDGAWCWVQLFGNSATDTAVTDQSGESPVNVSVDTDPSLLSPVLEGSVTLELEPGETATVRVKSENAIASGYYAVLIPQIRDAVSANGITVATLSVAEDGSGQITVTAVASGQAEVALPLYDGQSNPITLQITVPGEVVDPDPEPEEPEPTEEVPDSQPEVSNPFVDVKESDYFYDSVLWAVEKGITNGMDDTHFGPGLNCTRGQIVTFLWRAWNSPEPQTQVNPFSDVSESDYYYKAVLWAVENGITTGMDTTHFGPGRACTRAQAATFLWRSSGEPEPQTQRNPFSDVKSTEYYYSAVLWAVENGITNGMGDGKFAPDSTCTRGQIVTFLFRAESGADA